MPYHESPDFEAATRSFYTRVLGLEEGGFGGGYIGFGSGQAQVIFAPPGVKPVLPDMGVDVDSREAVNAAYAHPRPGLRYRQEYYKDHAEDEASIVSLREQAEVPAGHDRRVLMIREVNPLQRKVLEFKFYARGVGPVLAVSVSGGSDREELTSLKNG